MRQLVRYCGALSPIAGRTWTPGGRWGARSLRVLGPFVLVGASLSCYRLDGVSYHGAGVRAHEPTIWCACSSCALVFGVTA